MVPMWEDFRILPPEQVSLEIELNLSTSNKKPKLARTKKLDKCLTSICESVDKI